MTQLRPDVIPPSKLYVIDRDQSAVDPLRRFSRTSGVDTLFFRSGTDFVQVYVPSTPSCVVLSVEPPGNAEIALIETIRTRRDPIEVVALGAPAAVGIAVRSLKAGVFNFLEKPCSDFELVANVSAAIEQARRNFVTLRQWNDFERRLAELTDRQREILHHIVLGKANKVIAMDIGISERTVEVHRQRLLRRMCVGSAVELARLTGEFHAAQVGPLCACAERIARGGVPTRQPRSIETVLAAVAS